MKRGCLLMGFLLLVFLSLVQAACVQSYGSKAHSESNSLSRSDFAEKSEVRVDTLDVRPAMTRTRKAALAKILMPVKAATYSNNHS